MDCSLKAEEQAGSGNNDEEKTLPSSPSSKRPKVTHEEDNVEVPSYSEWMRNILAKPCSEITDEEWVGLSFNFSGHLGTCSRAIDEILTTNHSSVHLDHFKEDKFDQIEKRTTWNDSESLLSRCLSYYRELNRFLSLECDLEPAFSDKIFYLMDQRCKKLILEIQRREENESEARRAPEGGQKRVYPLFERFMSNLPTNLEHLEIHIKDMDVLDCFPDLIVRKGTKLRKLTLLVAESLYHRHEFSERDRVELLLYRCRHVKDLTLRNFPFRDQVSVEHLQIERWLKGLPLLRTKKLPVFDSDCETLRLHHDIYRQYLDRIPILCHLDTTFNHLKRLDMVVRYLPIKRDFWADMFSKTFRTLRTVKLGNGLNYYGGHIQAEAMINEAVEGPYALKLDCLWFSGAVPNFGDFFKCQKSRMLHSLRLHLKSKPPDEPSDEESSDNNGDEDEEEEEDLNCWRVLPCEISRYEALTELYLSFDDEDANTFLAELLPTLKNLKRLSIDLRNKHTLNEESIQIISRIPLESLSLIRVNERDWWNNRNLDPVIPTLCGLQSTPPLMLSLRHLSTIHSLPIASIIELLSKFKNLTSISFGKAVEYDSESSGELFLRALTKHGKLMDCDFDITYSASYNYETDSDSDETDEDPLFDAYRKFDCLIDIVCRKNRMRRWLRRSSENLKGKCIPQVLWECVREEKRLRDSLHDDDELMDFEASVIFEILKDGEVLRELGLA